MRHTRRATWFYPDADRLIAELARDAQRRRDRAWFLALVGLRLRRDPRRNTRGGAHGRAGRRASGAGEDPMSAPAMNTNAAGRRRRL
jgi:hypothetical protein